ncbi:MAG: NAD(P)/FAD-dependent oxidoreductase [Streptosporangiaceae bacterium]|nr:NAD(P)/FAD-dependent oxidoreductase [Streptosporangiaceae bacterium]
MLSMPDAVVVGAGPNGLVAANILADAGWAVEVLEAQSEPVGAVRSDHGAHPDYVSDVCSAFYPFGVASPAMRRLELERHGLRWRHAPAVLAHPTPDGRCAVLERDPERTAASLEELGQGDGAAWLRLYSLWQYVGDDLIAALFSPFPPVRAAAVLAVKARRSGNALSLARLMALPVRRMGEEEFGGAGGRLLLAGAALHVDLSQRPPAAEPSAGCSPCWASTTDGRCRRAAPVSSPARSFGAWSRAGAGSAAAPRSPAWS